MSGWERMRRLEAARENITLAIERLSTERVTVQWCKCRWLLRRGALWARRKQPWLLKADR